MRSARHAHAAQVITWDTQYGGEARAGLQRIKKRFVGFKNYILNRFKRVFSYLNARDAVASDYLKMRSRFNEVFHDLSESARALVLCSNRSARAVKPF